MQHDRSLRRARIERLVLHLATLFDGLAADSRSDRSHSDPHTEEYQQVVVTCNETAASYSATRSSAFLRRPRHS